MKTATKPATVSLAEFSDILDVDDLKAILRIGNNYAYQLLKDGRIRSIRIGQQHRIPKAEVIRFIREEVNRND